MTRTFEWLRRSVLTSPRAARSALFVAAALAVASIVPAALGAGQTGFDLVGLFGVPIAAIGVLVVARARNPIGWFFISGGSAIALTGLTEAYIKYSVVVRQTPLPGTEGAGWFNNLAFTMLAAIPPLIFLVFPTGRIPSPRWRPVVWLWMAGVAALLVASAVKPTEVYGQPGPPRISVLNPIGIEALRPITGPVIQAGAVAVLVVVGLSIVSLVVRFFRSRGEERQQMKWLVFVGTLLAIGFITLAIIDAASGDHPTGAWNVVSGITWTLFALLFGLGIPGAVVIAVLKYRLYDIDVVINKTLVYGSLAAFITAVYVGIVVGIGALIGAGSSQPNLGLSILATALVAVAFQPVRERIQRLANRLVYGKRATPYEVLSEFGHRMAGTYGAEDVLPRMARILAEGTGAKEARVWLKTSGTLTPTASWPIDGANGSAPQPDGADLLIPVTHQGEELGALSVTKAAGDRITPAEEKLTTDLASQAGLVLRNVKLIEDLKASRVRLVQAQDEERRKIERNIHDGAQQQLVALNVKLGLAKALASKDQQKTDELLSQLQQETNQALADLRDLARGIYPPLLADQGLTAALEAQARRVAVPVTVEADGISRYPQDVEAAVYFCTLEALQNVAKYANASQAQVVMSAADGQLSFTVTDDGAGFDSTTTSYGTGLQGMADRLAALGGEIDVRSRPGEGTTVSGRLPVPVMEAVG